MTELSKQETGKAQGTHPPEALARWVF